MLCLPVYIAERSAVTLGLWLFGVLVAKELILSAAQGSLLDELVY